MADPNISDAGPGRSMLTYRYRAQPTRQQHAALARILEDQRQLYNSALQERIDAYQRSLLGVDRRLHAKPHTITYFDQTNSLTKCRQALPEMAAVPAFLQRFPRITVDWDTSQADDFRTRGDGVDDRCDRHRMP